MESDIFDFWSFLTIFLRPDQILIKCKQCFVDFKYIIVPLFHKIFHDNIEFARMWQSESGLAKHILHFYERQFKSQCKRKHRLLGWPIELVRTKLGKQFPVNVRFFIALCISHTLFINFYSSFLWIDFTNLFQEFFAQHVSNGQRNQKSAYRKYKILHALLDPSEYSDVR